MVIERAESSYPTDSRFIKPTHSRLIYYALVAVLRHKEIKHKTSLHISYLSGGESKPFFFFFFYTPVRDTFGSEPGER